MIQGLSGTSVTTSLGRGIGSQNNDNSVEDSRGLNSATGYPQSRSQREHTFVAVHPGTITGAGDSQF